MKSCTRHALVWQWRGTGLAPAWRRRVPGGLASLRLVWHYAGIRKDIANAPEAGGRTMDSDI